MFSDVRTVLVLLNVINSSPRDLVSLQEKTYRQFFPQHSVPPEQVVKNESGDVSLVLINKHKAIKYLKETYGFLSRNELDKEIKDAR